MKGFQGASLMVTLATQLCGGPVAAQVTHSQDVGSQMIRNAVLAFESKEVKEYLIVGGKEVSIKDFPWQVALVVASIPDNAVAQFCGGAVVGETWILTAAHCVDRGTVPDQLKVLIDTDDLSSQGTRMGVKRIIVHPAWRSSDNLNDIALLELSAGVTADHIAVLSAANAGTAPAPEEMVTVSGWGRVREVGPTSSRLRAVTIPVQSNEACNKPDSYDGAVSDSMFCAGQPTGGEDSCQGDSGGPAVSGSRGAARLVGIVSWGEGCARAKKYGVYTRLADFDDWIDDNLGSNSTSQEAKQRQ